MALGRALLIQDLLAAGRLVAPFKDQMVKSPCAYSLVYPPEIADRPGIKAVIEWLREQVSTPPKTMRPTMDERRPLKRERRAEAVEGHAYWAA